MYELGRSKRANQGYSFDDVAIAPVRRTRSQQEVDLTWRIDAVSFDVPIVAAPMDSVMSPATAIRMGQLGGLGVLNLEGLWTRYEDPQEQYEQITAGGDQVSITKRMQEIYAEPIKPELIEARLAELRAADVPVAGSLSPSTTAEFADVIQKAAMDFFVIRGTTVSAEHVGGEDALNLKEFIYRLDTPVLVGGVATYRAALHLMRAGAAGVLVGFGGGATHTTASVLGIEVPMATAVANVAEARRDYLEESGGRYVHLIADGAVGRSGDIAKAIACGADAVMVGSPLARATEAPGRGWHWGDEAWHAELPRGAASFFEQVGSLEEVVLGPSRIPDGTMNLAGGLRKAMALTGYTDIKSFQRIDLILH
ncbi:GuaB3 family IMP dehydrogenase-related protein [Tessaracoccus caeni]|uniref:GuaB3 family IMP dehydrogenase-related protein n=1 Tax=Tessaracoccus caeni TaxID=3031239 RepID=UPI0023DB3DB2|nr:GuaB3 family IMP dehydrogenase-related protein [Tessaracoccus caeni]MDF1488323.1 GuaB3 family IMP dehydrogenase-related protein [Tessaracoccus caeni]